VEGFYSVECFRISNFTTSSSLSVSKHNQVGTNKPMILTSLCLTRTLTRLPFTNKVQRFTLIFEVTFSLKYINCEALNAFTLRNGVVLTTSRCYKKTVKSTYVKITYSTTALLTSQCMSSGLPTLPPSWVKTIHSHKSVKYIGPQCRAQVIFYETFIPRRKFHSYPIKIQCSAVSSVL